jgi:hypothetical protein
VKQTNKTNIMAKPNNTPAAPTQSVKVDSKTGNLRLVDIIALHPDLKQNPINHAGSGGVQGRQPARVKAKDMCAALDSFIFSAGGSVRTLTDEEKTAAIAGKTPAEIVAFFGNEANFKQQIPGASMTLKEWKVKSPDAELMVTKGQLTRAYAAAIDMMYEAINPTEKKEKAVETVANPAPTVA